MKTTKEKADELVFEFRIHANMWDCYDDVPNEDKNDIQCAILSVKNTIEVLERLPLQYETTQVIIEQEQLLKELESRV